MSKITKKRANLAPKGLTIQSRGSDVDTQKCVEIVGNRYELILLAAARGRELAYTKIDKPIIAALLEIQNSTQTA